MSIEETIEKRINHEKQNEEKMYDKAMLDRARLENYLYLKKRKKLHLRNLKNKQTIEGQRAFDDPNNKMASEVKESLRKSKSMEKKPK